MLDDPGRVLDDALASPAYMKVLAGAMKFDEDQPCMGFPLLNSGSAKVIKAAPNGRELDLYDVRPGEACVLTSRCLVDSARDEARGITREPVELVVLPPAAFCTLINSVAPFREFVFKRFAERMADLLDLISAVTFQKLDERLAGAIASRPSPIRTTHQALVDELGSVREIVSRLLKNFESQGWVRLAREQMEVFDGEALRRLSAE
ncbi:transcriptional regulator [beta proteobacterium AAP51]|nr:transcriptional regulator [beta proteobacterium AAP51]